MTSALLYPYNTKFLELLGEQDRWKHIKVVSFPVAKLTPTQNDVSLKRLKELKDGGLPETGDPYPHVVQHKGKWYVHDGHHRWVIALLGGRQMLSVRLIKEDEVAE